MPSFKPKYNFDFNQSEGFDIMAEVVNSISESIRRQNQDIDDKIKEMLIEHGYEKQMNKALYGKTQKMRTRNQNIIKKLVEVYFYPFEIDGLSGTQNTTVRWIGQ